MTDLVEFLRARLAEDRAWTDNPECAEDPARVLREVEAKRRIIEKYEHARDNCRAHPDDLASSGALLALHGVIKMLALPYADHPDYDQEL